MRHRMHPTSTINNLFPGAIRSTADSRTYGVSSLFISHDLAVVERLCHRIAVMQAGRIVETGSTDAIIGDPRESYTKTLIAAVPGRIAPMVTAVPERQSLAG